MVISKKYRYFIALFCLSFFLFDPSFLSAQKPELVLPIGHTYDITSVCFSPDGRFVLSGGYEDNLKLWDVQTGKEIRSFLGHKGSVNSVSFSPDGRFALSGSNDSTLKLWDAFTGKEIRTFKGHTGSVNSVSFSPDSRYVLSGSSDRLLKLWDVQSGEEIRSFQGHTSEVTSVCFSPDGSSVLSGSFDLTVRLWDVKTTKEIRRFIGHTWHVTSVCYSPDGRYVLSGSTDHTIRLWDVQSGKEIRSFQGHTSEVTSVCFSSDGCYALSGSGDKILKLWNVQTGKEIRSYVGHSSWINAVSISPDGCYALSSSSHYVLSSNNDQKIKLWDIKTGKEIRSFEGHTHQVNSVCISPNGRYAALGSDDNTIKLWDFQTGKEIHSFQASLYFGVKSVCFSPDGHYMLSGGGDNTLRLWDVQSGKAIRSFKGHTRSVESVCFSPNGLYAVSGSSDGTFKLWDIQTGKEIHSFNAHKDWVQSVCFSPDGYYVLSGSSDTTLKLWDVQTYKEVCSFKGHTSSVNSVCFSPNGFQVLSGSEDETIKLWDVQTGKEIRTFKGHTASVYSVCFSPDGNYALSGSYDNTLKLWNVKSGKEIHSFKGHVLCIISACFSPDGKYALSGSFDHTLKLWDVQTGKEIATLISVDSTDWIVTTPSGLFDASPGAMKLMHFVVGMEVIEFDQLKKRYWQPGLLPILIGYSKEKLREVPAFDYVRLYPEKQLSIADDELTIHLKNRGGGIGRVNVFIDDIQVIPDARSSPADSIKDDLVIKVNLSEFRKLLNYDQVNVVKVVAWNAEDYISSRPDTIHYIPRHTDAKGILLVTAGNEQLTEQPALWAVIVGTSDYSGNEIDLQYAAKDASDFANALLLGANRLFSPDSTHITLLTNDIQDNLPTKRDIEKAFLELKKSSPKDIIVVYFSGHGVNYGSGDGDFYYLTSDASSTEAEYFSDPVLSYNYSVSGSELVEWLKVPARKKLVILDACAAGKGAETMALAMKDAPKSQERILDQMQYQAGFYILAGAAGDKSSFESPKYGQGLLTYTLLKGMQGAQLKIEGGEEYVDVPLLMQYAVKEVPRLAEEEGHNQQPFVRSPDIQTVLYIGRMTEEDKEKIRLSEPRPVFIGSKFQNTDLMGKDIRLDALVNAQLREITAKGKEAKLGFSEGLVPGAYQIRGQYAIKGENIKVNYVLAKDEQIIGQALETNGRMDNLEELVKEIISRIEALVR